MVDYSNRYYLVYKPWIKNRGTAWASDIHHILDLNTLSVKAINKGDVSHVYDQYFDFEQIHKHHPAYTNEAIGVTYVLSYTYGDLMSFQIKDRCYHIDLKDNQADAAIRLWAKDVRPILEMNSDGRTLPSTGYLELGYIFVKEGIVCIRLHSILTGYDDMWFTLYFEGDTGEYIGVVVEHSTANCWCRYEPVDAKFEQVIAKMSLLDY